MASRYDRNRKAGIVDRAIALPREARETDQLAAEAEWFIADRYGLPRTVNDGPDEGWDFVLDHQPRAKARATTVDIKWTPLLNGSLLCVLGKVRAHVYVLVVGPVRADFQAVGFAWAATLRASVRDKGHGPTHALTQDELHPNVDLLFASCGYPPL
jgi:hypothetical protein